MILDISFSDIIKWFISRKDGESQSFELSSFFSRKDAKAQSFYGNLTLTLRLCDFASNFILYTQPLSPKLR